MNVWVQSVEVYKMSLLQGQMLPIDLYLVMIHFLDVLLCYLNWCMLPDIVDSSRNRLSFPRPPFLVAPFKLRYHSPFLNRKDNSWIILVGMLILLCSLDMFIKLLSESAALVPFRSFWSVINYRSIRSANSFIMLIQGSSRLLREKWDVGRVISSYNSLLLHTVTSRTCNWIPSLIGRFLSKLWNQILLNGGGGVSCCFLFFLAISNKETR